MMVSHNEVDVGYADSDNVYRVLCPERVETISYPYEWCFSQLKDAALLMLRIQRIALAHGMTLKDCSAYNIQFVKGSPMLIDTLSFEKYQEGTPWGAYKQFCQHFLAPLALMAYKDVRLSQLLRIHMDGIPLDLANTLLPLRTWFSLPLLLHIHLHSRSQKYYAGRGMSGKILRKGIGMTSLLGLIDSLKSCVGELKWHPKSTEWESYYEDDSYSPEAITHKVQMVSDFLRRVRPTVVWDLGANTGLFSRSASGKRIHTVSFDVDPVCVEINYLAVRGRGETNILPLLLDLTNPSPGIGWENKERTPIWERSRADTIMVLALVHHLAIANNIPLDRVARFLSGICDTLIIEFVPKSDPKVQKLLSTRKDVFPNYTQEAFEEEFSKLFRIREQVGIKDSQRTLYLMGSWRDVA